MYKVFFIYNPLYDLFNYYKKSQKPNNITL